MKQTEVTVTLAPATSTTYICASQALVAAGNLVLNGTGAATKTNQLMATAVVTVVCDTNANCRQLTIVSIASDESGKTFTVSGRLAKNGPVVTEAITGPTAGATVTSANYFYEVTQIAVSAALTANVSVGINAVGASQAIPVDHYMHPFSINQVMSAFSSAGTPNFTVQHTTSPVQDTAATLANSVVWFDDATAAAKTSAFESVLNTPVRAIRLKNNSGTGSCTLGLMQAGPG